MDQVNASLPIRPEIALLVTIGKTARIARFIRSSTAIKISSKVNWYWFLNLINPFWYLQSLVRLCQSCFARINNNNTSKNKKHSASVADDFTSGGISNDDSQFLQQQQSTWGGGALAAIREDERTKAQARPSGLRSWPGRVVRQLGVGSSASNWRRQIAATRIQRAWRRYQASQQGGGHNAPVTKRSRSKRASSKLERRLSATSGSKRRLESQVGTAMRELTGQRVAIGIIMALVLTVLFTYTEDDATRPTTMIVLHNQTGNPLFVDKSLDVARQTAVPDLFLYTLADGSMRNFSIPEVTQDYSGLRPRERYVVTVVDYFGGSTQGVFAYRDERKEEALVSTLSTLFILLVWFFGVTAFAGPVMVLVVIPIERMNSLLSMLMQNPLGYETTHRYKRFIDEEDAITKNTRWTKEVLKGMETSFLMSTILRIGSLMKVGFGSAGVEIIRNNLEKGQNKNMLMLNSQGSSVSCIFLFCDIRQFTDATECLQEEVFVFTNRIAAVVHSICTAYGGSANKNIGDAFLLSWLLDDGDPSMNFDGDDNFTANSNQADKALLSVVRICMALHYDDFYIGAMSDQARNALLTKLAKRKGPVVQMGFGLHAGKAVQGAIGSQRKIDATYVSEHVEKAEFLESSTKKYGVMMLMSDAFHRLLQPNNKRRCRKVDQLLVLEDAEDWEDDYFDDASGKRIDLYTFDMDIDALWRNQTNKKASKPDNDQESDSDTGSGKGVTTSRRDVLRLSGGRLMAARRRSVATLKDQASEDLSDARGSVADDKDGGAASELVLPSGPAIYNANVWISEEMRKVRFLYTDGLFFQKFSSGLQAFYSKDWDFAKQCFSTILDRFEDGPSRYFMSQIETNDGVPPKGFKEYGTA
jgi:class 3 adenylate cyclase